MKPTQESIETRLASAEPDVEVLLAEPLYERVRAALGAKGGRFGARMAVALVGDGPVTLVLDSP